MLADLKPVSERGRPGVGYAEVRRVGGGEVPSHCPLSGCDVPERFEDSRPAAEDTQHTRRGKHCSDKRCRSRPHASR